MIIQELTANLYNAIKSLKIGERTGVYIETAFDKDLSIMVEQLSNRRYKNKFSITIQYNEEVKVSHMIGAFNDVARQATLDALDFVLRDTLILE